MKKLTHYLQCTGQIKLITGMHIGGPKDSIKIGGIDNPVIRHPITNMPYIPGSSLKGRFRMALEVKYNDVAQENAGVGPSQDQNNPSLVCKLFGNGSSKTNIEPTRLIFRDAQLAEGNDDYAVGEEKIEVKMDREKMAGFRGGNRVQERIPAGAKFDFEITARVFEGDDESQFKARVDEAIKIVQNEYLGGSGTRGYGQVQFESVKWEKIAI